MRCQAVQTACTGGLRRSCAMKLCRQATDVPLKAGRGPAVQTRSRSASEEGRTGSLEGLLARDDVQAAAAAEEARGVEADLRGGARQRAAALLGSGGGRSQLRPTAARRLLPPRALRPYTRYSGGAAPDRSSVGTGGKPSVLCTLVCQQHSTHARGSCKLARGRLDRSPRRCTGEAPYHSRQ